MGAAGRIAFSVAGAAIGAYFGNPGLGFALGSTIGTLLFPPGSDQRVEGSRLSDLTVGSSSLGVPIPKVYGIARLAGNLIWSTDLQEESVEEEQSQGKGGGPSATTVTYLYSVSLAIMLCEGPIAGVRRVWANGKLVVDYRETNTGPSIKYPEAPWTFYLGTEEQLPSPLIEADQGVGQVPGYRGWAYATVEDFPLLDFGNVIPNFTFEVYTLGTPVWPMVTFEDAYMAGAALIYDAPSASVYGYAFDLLGDSLYHVTRINSLTDTILYNAPIAGYDIFATGALAVDGARHLLYVVGTPDGWTGGSNRKAVLGLDTETGLLTSTLISPDPALGAPYDITVAGDWVIVCWQFGYSGFVSGYLWTWATDEFGTATETLVLQHSVNISAGIVGADVEVTADAATSTYTRTTGSWLDDGFQIDAEITRKITFSGFVNAANNGLHTLVAVSDSTLTVAETLVDETAVVDFTGFTGLSPRAAVVDRDGVAWVLCSAWAAALSFATGLWRVSTSGEYRIIDVSDQIGNGQYLSYDAVDHALLLYSPYVPGTEAAPEGDGSIWKWDIASESFVGQSPGGMSSSYQLQTFKQGPVGGSLWTIGSAYPGLRFNELDTRTMELKRYLSPALWEDSSTDLGIVYDGTSNALWTTNASFPPQKHLLDRSSVETPTLQSIVEDLCAKAGLSPADYDATALAGTAITGYVVSRRQTVRDALEPLQRGFFFDGVETDDLIRWVPRGGASAVTIPESDLATHAAGEERPPLVIETRTQEVELPEQVEVVYLSQSRDYEQATQLSKRVVAPLPAVFSRDLVSVQLPIIMTEDQAKQTAEKLLYTAWQERIRVEAMTHLGYARLDPSDVITLEADGVSYLVRLTQINQGANGQLALQAVVDHPNVYDTSTPAVDVSLEAPGIQYIGPSVLYLLDTPILRDADDEAGLYLAGYGLATTWPGEVAYWSQDGSAYTRATSMNTPVVSGVATTVLGDHGPYTWDRANTVRVRLARGSLSSLDELSVLNGGNAGLLGNEIIQWQTATPIDASTWELSLLLRGRKGTEWASASHASGERFVLIESATWRRYAMDSAHLHSTRYWKGVTVGALLTATGYQSFINSGKGLKCYAPVRLAGTRDGANNLTLTWLRRTRIGGEWNDLTDVPLGETAELYDLEVLDAPGGAVLRTVAGLSSATYTYTATDQTSDGITPGDSVSVRVYQINATLGQGYPGSATL
jgi:hypothetical protein